MARASAASGRKKKESVLAELEAALAKSVKTVFGTIVFMKVEPAAEGDGERSIDGKRYSGSVAFWGETPGLLMLHVGADRAAKIAANVLGLPADKRPDPDVVRDAVVEVCSLVADNLRAALAATHPSVNTSLPTVVYGSDFDVSPGSKADRLQLSLRSEQDPVCVEYFLWSSPQT